MNSTAKANIDKTCLGGWDSRTTFVNKFRAEVGHENMLLLDTGDILSGT